MTRIDALLEEYGASHRHPVNKTIHRIAVPIIALDILGLAHAVPLRALCDAAAPSAATVLTIMAVVYYARLSPALAAGMAGLAAVGLAAVAAANAALGTAFVPVLLAIFALAWVAQFYGHVVEGKRPSFLRDLQFLLIGPLWLLADVYQRVGWAPVRASRPLPGGAESLAGNAGKN